MQNITSPVNKNLIKSELTTERFLRTTNKANNEIYIVNHHNAPHTMMEIGRLREIAFRHAGGGTGLSTDIDQYDTMSNPYQQLIVWNPDAEEVLGGYRFLLGDEVDLDANNQPVMATSHLFHFSDHFVKEYLPHTLELGRSFVTLEYQSSRAGAKGLFALDNLWDGLGALTVKYPQIDYYFGKVTMYPSYPSEGRNMILYFLYKHFGDKDSLVTPLQSLNANINFEKYDSMFTGENIKEDYRILNYNIRSMGINIPPLVNAYMNLSPTMRMFGTAVNDTFGDVEETGILVVVKEILEEKRVRHIETYDRNEFKIG